MNQAAETSIQGNEDVVTFLNLLLSDEYVLYTKTRAAHWIVNGSNYFELHGFLESQCNELDAIIVEIAENIRSNGHFASVFRKDFLGIAQMSDNNHNFESSEQIFESLVAQHETIIHSIQHEIFTNSDHLENIVTADLITEIIERHMKMVWILRLFMYNHEFSKNNQIRSINTSQSIELIKAEMEF